MNSAGSSLQTNPVACITCKIRKVKCDRVLPRCGRCIAYNIECVFLERQGRVGRPPKEKAEKISSLLDRLSKVESAVHSQMGPPQYGRSQSAPDAPARLDTEMTSPTPNVQSPSPTVQQFRSSSTLFNSAASTPQQSRSSSNAHEFPLAGADGSPEIYNSLQNAVQRLSGTKLRKMFHANRIMQGFDVPSERAKGWISNYFDSMPVNIDPSVRRNAALLRLIPDLIRLEHVHIEPAMVVLYFLVLYYGCCLSNDETARLDVDNAYMLALRSIPAWQRDAVGSTLDISVAALMSRAAIECYDVDLGYQMHSLACDYAQGLNMHRLDAEDGASVPGPGISQSDADRRRFWDLVQYDAYFRLMLNKSSAFSIPMNEWKVNLPYLNTDLQVGEPAIMFLFDSRLTLDLARFFQLIDGMEDKEALRFEIETMCQSIRARYHEWQIDKALIRAYMTKTDHRLVTDGAIAGLLSIILMLRSVAAIDSPLMLETSRYVLRTMERTISQAQSPTAAVTSFGFFSLIAFMPYAIVAEHAARVEYFEVDIALLEKLRDSVMAICREEVDFLPLARAMQKACSHARNGRESGHS